MNAHTLSHNAYLLALVLDGNRWPETHLLARS